MFLSGLVVGRVRYKCMQSVRQFSSNLTVEKSSSKAGKRYASPMITLHQLGGKKITVVTLDEATRLSKRRSLRLVKTASASGNMERDEYRLFTEKDFLKFKGDEDISVEAEEVCIEEKLKTKSDKVTSLHSRMGEHDILSKIKQLHKWVKKLHHVRVDISAADGNVNSAEKIVETIVKTIDVDGKIVQKQSKGNEIKFKIVPTDCLKK